MKKLFEKKNDDGMEVYIIVGDNGFHVCLTDLDSGNMAGVICCPTYDMAVKKANEVIE